MRACVLNILLGLVTMLLSSCPHNLINAQGYFSKVLSTKTPSPVSIVGLDIIDDNLLISGISTNPESIILKTDTAGKLIELISFEEFTFSRNPLCISGESIFSYSKIRENEAELLIHEMGSNFNINNEYSYHTEGEYSFPTYSDCQAEFMFNCSLDDFDGGDKRMIHIRKSLFNNEEVWSKYFNQDITISYPWEIFAEPEGYITLASLIFRSGEFEAYDQLMKIDSEGNVYWTYEGVEGLSGGSANTWVTKLSNGYYLLSSELNKNSDPLYAGYYLKPTKLTWINNSGEDIQIHYLKVDNRKRLLISQVVTGFKDNFLVFGRLYDKDLEEYFGIIYNFSNSGELLWEKKIQHNPSSVKKHYNHIIDLFQKENGDIFGVGHTGTITDPFNIWVFKINEYGCFGSEYCDEIIIYTSTQEESLSSNLNLYPNPSYDIIYIDIPEYIQRGRIVVYDATGSIVDEKEYDYFQSTESISTEYLSPGIYIVTIIPETGESITKKIVVQR